MRTGLKGTVFTLFTIIVLVMILTACTTAVRFNISFSVDDEIIKTVDTNGKEVITMPADPVKEGYIFDGWYWDKGVWKKPFTANSLLDAPLSEDMTVYAKWTTEEEKGLTSVSFASFEKIDDRSYQITISSDKDTLFLSDYVTIPSDWSWSLSTDISANNPIKSKVATLTTGDNVYYLLVSSGDGQSDLYILHLYRQRKCTVLFLNDGVTVDTKEVEEGGFVVAPVLTKEGYRFMGWDYDLTQPISKDETISAIWEAEENIPYTVEYYLRNQEDNDYTLTDKVESTGKTGAAAVAENKTYEHFTLDADKSTAEGKILADGSLVLRLYYNRATYAYSVKNEDAKGGEIVCPEDGAYEYGTEITLSARESDGYDFAGWFEGDKTLSTEKEYTFAIEKDTAIQAKWEAHKNTPYVVEYYWQNVENDLYTLAEKIESEGVTGADVTAEKKEYPHFLFNQNASIPTGKIFGDGSLVLKMYYTREICQVSLNAEGETMILKNKAGSYKYGTVVDLGEAIVALGYDFDGWYENNVKKSETPLLSAYSVDRSISLVAKSKVKEEMRGFDFLSTTSSCIIRGVKDKTVKEITIPSYVTGLKEALFSGCSSLEKLTIPFLGSGENGNRTDPDREIFGYLFGKTEYDGSKGVNQTYWSDTGSSAWATYYFPTSLSQVEVLGGTIYRSAFAEVKMLTSVVLGADVVGIESAAFRACSNLSSVTISKSITKIETDAFQSCTNLQSVRFEEGSKLESIEDYGFAFCEKLEDFTFPEGVTSIKNYAFYGCALTELRLPKLLSGIGKDAFTQNDLEKIEVDTDNETYFVSENCLITKATNRLVLGCKNSVLPTDGTLTSIGDSAFAGVNGLTTIAIPVGVKTISHRAFAGCKGLESVTIAEGVTLIDEYAFAGCTALTSVTIPASTVKIGNSAFNGDVLLERVNFAEGSQLTTFGRQVFRGCSALETFVIPSGVNGTIDGVFAECGKLASINIPSGVNYISFAFYCCYQLTSVTIPAGVKSIGQLCFSGCTKLESVTFEAGSLLTEIGYSAFYSCTKLTSIDLPDGVTKIDQKAFYCSGLTSITIPSAVTRIESLAFAGCTGITSVAIPKAVVYIGEEAFESCALSSLSFEENSQLLMIKASAFAYNADLITVNIPYSVLTIEYGVFLGCTQLTMLVYPGTKTEWERVFDGASWNGDAMYYIKCSDATYIKYE